MIDLDCLASFVAVAEAGSFGAAAARRGLSQSGISQHVARLEAALGERLVERGRHASVPSQAGRRLLPLALELLRLEQRARDAARAPRLCIGASGNIAVFLLPELIGRFSASAAGRDVPVDVSTHPNPEVLRWLSIRLVDIGLVEWAPVDPAFQAIAWRQEPLGLIVPPGHRLSGQGRVSIEQIMAEPMLGGEPGSGTATLLREAFGATAARLAARQSYGSTEGVKRAVRSGLGVSIVMRIAVVPELERGELVWLDLDGPRLVKSLYLVCRADDRPDTRVEAFVEWLLRGEGRVVDSTAQASRPER